MHVILAGYNVDREVIEGLKKSSPFREDATAQWDIRITAGAMSMLANKVMPLTCFLMGGKDSYSEIYEDIFGKLPKPSPLE